MKKQLIIFLLSLICLSGFAQTRTTLPYGARAYGNQLYLDPAGNVWGGTGSAKFRLIDTKLRVDSAIAAKVDSLARLKAPINSPTFTGTVSGITPSMIGLGNVNNTTDLLKPISTATQTALNLKEVVANKGIANGYASLDANGKLPSAQVPSIAISDTYTAANQTQMLSFTGADIGDVVVRTDLSKSYILVQSPGSTFLNWQELLTPTSAVQSVNSQVGVVTITKSSVGLGNVDNTTDLLKPVSTAIQTALNTKEGTLTAGTTSQYFRGDKSWQALSFAALSGKPTTVSGYGITDAYPLSGNPSGFLTSFSETDPGVSANVKAITAANILNWNTAYGWGNHSGLYLPLAGTAANSTKWNGFENRFSEGIFNSASDGITINSIPVYSSSGIMYRISAPFMHSFLGLNNNSTLINNIQGNADSWGGNAFANAESSVAPNYLLGAYSGGIVKYSNAASLRSFLTIPVGGETLQSVTSRGNVANVQVNFTNLGNTGYTFVGGSTSWARIGSSSVTMPLVLAEGGEKVGIGTTTPEYRLDVMGNGNFSSTVSSQATPTSAVHLTPKAYVDAADATKEALSNKDGNPGLGSSDTKYPTQNAVRQYVNNAITGLTSGTYTPVITVSDGVTSAYAHLFKYIRYGYIVQVTGTIGINLGASTTAGSVEISLPIASNFSTGDELSGLGNPGMSMNLFSEAYMAENQTADRATYVLKYTTPMSMEHDVTFMYQIK